MLKLLIVRLSRVPQLRQVAWASFRLPLLGGLVRRTIENVLPRDERIWFEVPAGPNKGTWLRVEPYWEGGLLTGYPELGVQEVLAEQLKPGDCLYDIGAHIGYYSLLAGRLVGPTGSVVAVEPDPDNIAVLRENIARNGIRNIAVVQAAASNQVGTIIFQRGADYPSRMSGHMVDSAVAPASGDFLSSPSVTLDLLGQTHQVPSVIKIDVEGNELQVLEGACDLITTYKPVLIFEVLTWQELEKVRAFLTSLHYHIRPLPLTHEADVVPANYLGLPTDSSQP